MCGPGGRAGERQSGAGQPTPSRFLSRQNLRPRGSFGAKHQDQGSLHLVDSDGFYVANSITIHDNVAFFNAAQTPPGGPREWAVGIGHCPFCAERAIHLPEVTF